VWSAGLFQRREAYSLAIVLAEALGIDECVRRVKIYGTDVDEEALREARTGLYPAKSLEALPENCGAVLRGERAQFVLRSTCAAG